MMKNIVLFILKSKNIASWGADCNQVFINRLELHVGGYLEEGWRVFRGLVVSLKRGGLLNILT